MTNADLRDRCPMGPFGAPAREVARLHGSSGRRGGPTLVGRCRADLGMWSLVMAGAMPGPLLHNAHGYGLFTGGLGIRQGAQRLGLGVAPASGGQTIHKLRLIANVRPDGIACAPPHLMNLAETCG